MSSAELQKAANLYGEVLTSDPKSSCAVRGTRRVAQARALEQRECKLAAALDEAKKGDEADRHYAAALRSDVASTCAKKGLAPATDKHVWHDVGAVLDYAPKVPAALGALLLIILTAAGAIVAGWTLVRRGRPSLVVSDLADAAVDPKVGAVVAALIQQRLVGLRKRSRHAGDGYDLDLVVADVELLTKDEDLSTAVGEIASVPQLQLFVAILTFVDRLLLKERLVANGDLLPSGARGPGIALSLGRRNGMAARDVIWADELAGWEGPAPAVPPPAPVAPGAAPAAAADPDPYYRLAIPAAAWVQYEAACALNDGAGLITTEPQSFALLSVALRLQREDDLIGAADLYVQALSVDPDNVAALFNLGLLVRRVTGQLTVAMWLVNRALSVLERRYEEQRA